MLSLARARGPTLSTLNPVENSMNETTNTNTTSLVALPTDPAVLAMLALAYRMSAAELRKQRLSWVRGQLGYAVAGEVEEDDADDAHDDGVCGSHDGEE